MTKVPIGNRIPGYVYCEYCLRYRPSDAEEVNLIPKGEYTLIVCEPCVIELFHKKQIVRTSVDGSPLEYAFTEDKLG
jgi:hypothetical protein